MEQTLNLIRQASRPAIQRLPRLRQIKSLQWIPTIWKRWTTSRETSLIPCTMLCSLATLKWVNHNACHIIKHYFKSFLFSVSARIYDVPTESKELEPASAVIAPSSITHTTSPQLQIRRLRELDPTSVDTGKDTQSLVEEDKSECWSMKLDFRRFMKNLRGKHF